MPPWIEALGAEAGLVALIGAGGKKTTLQRVAREHPGRVAVTATTFCGPLEALGSGARRRILDEAGAPLPALQEADAAGPWCILGPPSKKGRYAGLPPEQVRALHDKGGFDATLVKADGARMRGVKAPRAGEPVLPWHTERVVALLSAAVLGQPLTEAVAHRPERIAAVTGLAPGATLTPEALARLIADPRGLLCGTGMATVVPVINQVDDAERQEQAWLAARHALALAEGRLERVVLTCMTAAADPLVAVVR